MGKRLTSEYKGGVRSVVQLADTSTYCLRRILLSFALSWLSHSYMRHTANPQHEIVILLSSIRNNIQIHSFALVLPIKVLCIAAMISWLGCCQLPFRKLPKLSLVLFLVNSKNRMILLFLKKEFLEFSFVLRTQPTLLGLFFQAKPPFAFIISFKAEWSGTLFCTLV